MKVLYFFWSKKILLRHFQSLEDLVECRSLFALTQTSDRVDKRVLGAHEVILDKNKQQLNHFWKLVVKFYSRT